MNFFEKNNKTAMEKILDEKLHEILKHVRLSPQEWEISENSFEAALRQVEGYDEELEKLSKQYDALMECARKMNIEVDVKYVWFENFQEMVEKLHGV